MLCTCWLSQSHIDNACPQHPSRRLAILESQLMACGLWPVLLLIQFRSTLVCFRTRHLGMVPLFNPSLTTVEPRIPLWKLHTVRSIFCRIALLITPLVIWLESRLVALELDVPSREVRSAFARLTDAIFATALQSIDIFGQWGCLLGNWKSLCHWDTLPTFYDDSIAARLSQRFALWRIIVNKRKVYHLLLAKMSISHEQCWLPLVLLAVLWRN